MGFWPLIITTVCYAFVALDLGLVGKWHDFWIWMFYAAANLVWAHKLYL